MRLQLSMLFVPMAARMNFCATKFTSLVAFEHENMPNESGPSALHGRADPRCGAVERLVPRCGTQLPVRRAPAAR